jgi:hypothetical protein
MEQKNNFLHKKLPELQKSEEVQDAVDKHIRVTGEKVSNNPESRLEVYMDRLEKIFLNEDEETRKRNIEMLRDKIHNAFVIKREDVPESYFELQKRVARERGQPVEEIPQNIKEQMIDVIIEDQKHSLDSWVNYLSSNDAMYPTWFKYFAFRNIVKISQFDKELGKFKERTKATTAPFPDIYREALAQVSDLYESASRDKTLFNDKDFQIFLSKKFPTQYADKIQQTLEHSQEKNEQIKGEWVKYNQGDEEQAKKLYRSLAGKTTGWCTAGMSTAERQIECGDFYVYYSYNEEGKATIPRLAIRMNGTETIGEVRGVLPHQEVEPMLQEILDEKLSTFGNEADSYKKKSSDMKRLTLIEKDLDNKKGLTKDDILFLLEINTEIEGFGYKKDPRIAEIRKKIKKENIQDAFNLKPEELAEQLDEIKKETVLYVPEIKGYLSDPNKHKKVLSDITHLNSIEKRIEDNNNLSKEDLLFLYEVNLNIDSFGYVKDPRIGSLIKERILDNDLKLMFNEGQNITTNKDNINTLTDIFIDGKKIYSKNNGKYKNIFEDTACYNNILRKLSNEENISKDDLCLIYETKRIVNFFESKEITTSKLYRLKLEIKPEQYLKALGLEQQHLAKNVDEITEDTVLYIPQIKAYLSDNEEDKNKKIDYETKLNTEKSIRRIIKKNTKHEELTSEEIQFIFRKISDRFEIPFDYYSKTSDSNLREIVSKKNIESVFGNELANAIEKIYNSFNNLGFLYYGRDYGNDDKYFPYLKSKDGGSFLLCTSVGVEVLESLQWIEEDLRKLGYKLANEAELRELGDSDLFLNTHERVVYGNGYVWKKYLNNSPDMGHLLSLDDSQLKQDSYDMVSSEPKQDDDGFQKTQRALIAITKAVSDGLEKYDSPASDDELYRLQDKLSRK